VDAQTCTGLSVILSRGSDRAILTYPGSIPELRYAEIDLQLLGRARHLHLGSFYLLDALRPEIPTLFQQAHQLGLSTSLDTNYDPLEEWGGGLMQTLASTDVFLPNETELKAISGEGDCADGLKVLAERVPLVAVKRGEHGALARQGVHLAQAGAFPGKVVDTVGAGDSFDAGMVYAYLAGWDLEKSVEFACACGSLSTRQAGGTAGQATVEQALALIRMQ
jgi:sugar/nucleoside kinase (ribokinase family)